MKPLRGMIAPASLKLLVLRCDSSLALPPTPGHDCPGLIEATLSLVHAICQTSPLRGMIAPASLKHALGGGIRYYRLATPGHDCPGLIEAGPRLAAGRMWSTHSGHDCPGLIEASRRLSGPPPSSSPLRGMIAPASLKPGYPPVPRPSRPLPTPGHDCPGLIEARHRPPHTRPGSAPHSGA